MTARSGPEPARATVSLADAHLLSVIETAQADGVVHDHDDGSRFPPGIALHRIRAALAPFKSPALVRFVDRLPMAAGGKLELSGA